MTPPKSHNSFLCCSEEKEKEDTAKLKIFTKLERPSSDPTPWGPGEAPRGG